MKMVKSLLLGGAAGLLAVAGAQAADLPVKAKPVQYVKICSLYGAGFYYMPGTDTCLKIGGWVRAEYAYGDNGNMAWGWANNNNNNRGTNNSTFRARGYITADAREQTEYGTLRSYIAVGVNTSDVGLNTASNQFSANRAFIQFAGFTAGIAQSFFDFYSVPASSFWGSFPASDTGDPGWMVMAYKAQFGNGLSASISAEERRMTQIVSGAGNVAFGAAFPGSYGGFQAPDVVGNLRLDQAWGSAQIMAAAHEVNGQYYAGSINGPSDKWGFAVGGGIKLNAPMFGHNDYFQAQVTYAEGASRYVFMTPNSNWDKVTGATFGYGVLSDSVYGGAGATATDHQLTTAWGVNAAYDHGWNAQWKTSLYGGYAAISYNSSANAMLCAFEGAGAGAGSTAVPNPGCDNNWNTYWIGSRTQWNITKNLYVGLDVLYSKLRSTNLTNAAGVNTATNDVDNVGVRFRVHRDFYP